MESSLFVEIIKSPILSAIIGALTATFISPLIKWKIELRRKRTEKREKLLELIRQELNSKQFSIKEFRDSETYSRIRPLLSKEVQNKLWNFTNDILYADRGILETSLLKEEIFRELSRIEIKWKLI